MPEAASVTQMLSPAYSLPAYASPGGEIWSVMPSAVCAEITSGALPRSMLHPMVAPSPPSAETHDPPHAT